MMFKRFLAIAMLSLISFQGYATHLLGGEIVWKCKPNGKYQFTLTLYRECGSPVQISTNPQTLVNNTGTLISCAYIGTDNVVPTCYTGAEPCQAGAGLSGLGRMQKYTFRSGDIVLAGTPPPAGWTFSWSNCCRPQSVDNIVNAGSKAYYLRATMYPYTPPGSTSPLSGGTTANPTCYDSSPNFLEDPQVVACSSQDVVYNNLGYDPDLDSLYYIWADPLIAAATSAPWETGYSTTSQLPSISPSTAAILDNNIGTITFNSAENGSFATCLGIEAWRCNQKVGEIFRDIPVVVRSCLPPSGALCAASYNPIPPELNFTTDSSLAAPTVLSPVTNIAGDTVAYQTEGFPGDTIRFTMRAVDPWVHPNCTPQKISMEARGGNLSSAANYGNASICLFNPPCATIVPTGTSTSLSNVSGTLDAKFNWYLECNHLFYQEYICGSLKSDYEFYFKITDDQCPVPLTSYAKLLVKVKNYMPGIPNIDNTCIQQDDNGVTFDWVNNPDTGFNWDFYVINHIDTLGNTS
ncbi:MAG: hypothetical protein P8P80_00015, partial [Crocinitomicaceae bacterium]|nr:hypothetical protein [Crocinitomicaceae bacterium]